MYRCPFVPVRFDVSRLIETQGERLSVARAILENQKWDITGNGEIAHGGATGFDQQFCLTGTPFHSLDLRFI